MSGPEKPPRKSGLAHFFAAAGYSAAGLRRLSQESAFRQEAVMGVAVLAGLAVWGASGPQLLGRWRWCCWWCWSRR